MIEYEFSGFRSVAKELEELDVDIRKKVAKSALRKGAKPIRDTAISLAPIRSGTLRNAIRIGVLPKGTYGDAALGVIVRSGKKWQSKGQDAWYAPFIEYGTVKQNPQPFLRPALDWRGAEAIQLVAKGISERIAKIKEVQSGRKP